MSAHESVHKTPARHRLQVDQNQIPWRYEHPYQPSILIWYWEYYGGLVNRLLRFLVDVIWHQQQNRPKIDALDIAADTSAGSQFHDLPSTLTFSTSKTDLDHSFTMRWSPNWLCYGMAAHHGGCDAAVMGWNVFGKVGDEIFYPDREGKNQGKNQGKNSYPDSYPAG